MASSLRNVGRKAPARDLKDEIPPWLEEFVKIPYYSSCSLHNGANNRAFPMKSFCVDCRTPVCTSCILNDGHNGHSLIQVYRHVYQAAVLARTMKNFVNTVDIQTYKSNKDFVLAVHPLQYISKNSHAGHKACQKIGETSTNTGEIISLVSPRNRTAERSCWVCSKRLIPTQNYIYCSIRCKLTAYLNKPDRSMPPFLTLGDNDVDHKMVEEKVDGKDQSEAKDPSPPHRRSRKGIPCRAPLF